MPARKLFLMIVDEDREVRDCLRDLFAGAEYDVRLAENQEEALAALPEASAGAWPHVIILGQVPRSGPPRGFLEKLQARHPRAHDEVSLIVFPSFRVSLQGETEPGPPVQACRLRTVSNLLSVVQGLARNRAS